MNILNLHWGYYQQSLEHSRAIRSRRRAPAERSASTAWYAFADTRETLT